MVRVFGGVWKRTGETFRVWSQPVTNSFPGCRFFSTSFAPRSSHFYTPFPAECADVKNDPNWQYEGIAFHMQLPNTNALCPSGTQVLYRLYNNGMGAAPNHRYTTSLNTLNQMWLAGWDFEGDGRNGAFACVPSATPSRSTMEGYWFGSTNANEEIRGIVLSNGTYYFIYFVPGSNIIAGVVQGTTTTANGSFTSTNARDFNITPYHSVFSGNLTGNFLAQSVMQGTASVGAATLKIVSRLLLFRLRSAGESCSRGWNVYRIGRIIRRNPAWSSDLDLERYFLGECFGLHIFWNRSAAPVSQRVGRDGSIQRRQLHFRNEQSDRDCRL